MPYRLTRGFIRALCMVIPATTAVSAQDTTASRHQHAEIKAMLAPAALDALLGVLHQRRADARQRTIVFYDTPDMALTAAGITLRVRRRAQGEAEATVKIHDMRQADATASQLQHAGFSCEADVNGERHASTCAFSTTSPIAAADSVLRDHSAAVSTLFSSSQHKFLSRSGMPRLAREVTWPMLSAFGPIAALEWTAPAPYDRALTMAIELWQLADGTQLLELSMRVRDAEADVQQQRLQQWVTSAQLPLAPQQVGKTDAAMRALAGLRAR